MHRSIATIDNPEFINLQPLDLNPLMSSCEIKVLYVGENRNHSYITKDVATEMAKTLRGAPIVGYYKEEKQDYADHGEKIIFDDEGVKFECMTKPYGFVAPDAKVWFQSFNDEDEFGNTVTREYLMTTGFLWTGQYEECQSVIDNGKPQSMELDEESLDGHWATNNKTGMDFFIINDAIFSKLCILGDDVEPCFEGASVTAPEVSKQFTKMDDSFRQTLFTMIQDLKKYAIKGGQDMENENTDVEEVVNDENKIEEEVNNVEVINNDNAEQALDTESQEPTDAQPEADNAETEFVSKEDDEKKDEDNSDSEDTSSNEEENSESNDDNSNKEDAEEDKDKKYTLLETEYNDLQAQFSDLEAKYQALVEFKNSVENEKKDDLIKSFYMLSDEDKADVIANKATYSLDQIEAKLSVICVRKKVSFDLEDDETSKQDNKEDVITTFNLNDVATNVPAWVSALKNTQSKNNN